MTTIWKYHFEIRDRVEIEVPRGAKILHVGLDPHKQPSIWCMVDTESAKDKLEVFIRGTGHEVEMGIRSHYFSSFVDGMMVWHVFVRGRIMP